MDPFDGLTVGVKFGDSSYKRLFDKQSASFLPVRSSVPSLKGSTDSDPPSIISTPSPAFSLSIDNGNKTPEPNYLEANHTETESDVPLKPMSEKKMRNIWRKNNLQVTGDDVPSPIHHFSDLVRSPLNVQHHVVDNLFQRDHKVPTPIQLQAISTLIHRRDLLACAPTGSGKTIAFLVPLFTLLKSPNRHAGIRGLVITPTMELAVQIEREAFFLMRGKRWKYVQHGQTTKDKDFFVSTPARVVSLLKQNLLDLKAVEYLVFDEGDRLWDSKSGFFEDIDTIVAACTSHEKVIALFSATLSEKVEEAVRSIMNNPVRLIVAGRKVASRHVNQKLLFCGSELGKVVAMRNLIKEGITAPVLVFVQSIERSKELYDEINAAGLHMSVIHAKMTTNEREEAVLNFRLCKTWFLVTTELLARGIDFKNVNTVINFDFPLSVESYIHRIGRTGRAGKSGTAITFFTIDDKDRLPPIAAIMKESGSDVEDWMLNIKVNRTARKRLENTTPTRTIISTRKRVMIADKRYERQWKRVKGEESDTDED